MVWPFNSSKRELEREEDRRVKIAASQLALLEAATTTADAAQHVTSKLRQHLEDSIRQFESTARLISDALIVCDSAGQVIAFNPAAEIIFAISSKDIESAFVGKLFRINSQPVSDIEMLWKHIENGSDEGNNPILSGYRGSDESFFIDASLTRLGKEDGTTLILLLVRDLSDHIESKKLVAVHEQRFQSLFNFSFDGILIIQDAHIVAANKAVAQTFDVEPADLLSMTTSKLFRENIPVSTGENTIDDGNLHLLFSSTDITWNGNPAHLVTVKDVSQLHQLRQAVKGTDSGRDMICVFDKDFKITFANSYFSEYYNCPNPVGQDMRDLLPPSDRDTFSLKMLTMTPENATMRNQVQHMPTFGPPRFLDWIDHAVFDENGNIIEYQRTGKDITSILTSLMNRSLPTTKQPEQKPEQNTEQNAENAEEKPV